MAAPPLMRSLSTKAEQNKKLQRPRPLKTSSSQSRLSTDLSSQAVQFQELMNLVETVSQNIYEQSYSDMLTTSISVMSVKLKQYGPQLESIYKDQLDRAFHIYRDGCQDENLHCTSRLHLLELVELRANHWSDCDKTQIYYSAKMAASEVEPVATTPDANTTTIPMSTPSPPAPPVLSPGEILKTSGKFSKPTKIPGKNYCKDEVVIRNSDSGKVNPGAKERLVQITGPSEDKINHARQLMEDTIRRNASPIRDGSEREQIGDSNSSLNSSASDESGRLTHQGSRRSLLHSFSTNDASIGEYKYTATVGPNLTVKITGTNHEVVRNSRLVLEEYYDIWLQKNCMGDYYGLEEDVFMDPVASDMSLLGLNPLDSGNGNQQLSSSSGDSDDVTCISSITPPVTAVDPGLTYQPLYPPGPPFEKTLTARRNRLSTSSNPQSPTALETAHTRKYSREFLLSCAVSQLSRTTPPEWDQVAVRFPGIVKKATPPFDPTAFLAHPESSAVISSSQILNEPDSD